MAGILRAFTPLLNSTVSISATSTSGSTTVSSNGSNLLITNSGPNTVFVRWGVGAQTATTADMPVLSGTQVIVSRTLSVDTVAAICASGQTASVSFCPGEGE